MKFGKVEKILGALVVVAAGAVFAGGMTQSVPVLNYIPAIVHKVIGYALMILGGIGVFKAVKGGK